MEFIGSSLRRMKRQVVDETWLEIGRVIGAQGLRGEVKVYPDSDFPERFLVPGSRWLRRPNTSELEELELVQGRFLDGKGLYIMQFRQICDRTQAEALRNSTLLVPESDRPTLDQNEFYVRDLVGLKVILQATGAVIGTVTDVYAAGNDLLAVELSAAPASVETPGDKVKDAAPPATPSKKNPSPVLIPFVEEIVPVVDIAQGYVTINPPPGLLEG